MSHAVKLGPLLEVVLRIVLVVLCLDFVVGHGFNRPLVPATTTAPQALVLHIASHILLIHLLLLLLVHLLRRLSLLAEIVIWLLVEIVDIVNLVGVLVVLLLVGIELLLLCIVLLLLVHLHSRLILIRRHLLLHLLLLIARHGLINQGVRSHLIAQSFDLLFDYSCRLKILVRNCYILPLVQLSQLNRHLFQS